MFVVIRQKTLLKLALILGCSLTVFGSFMRSAEVPVYRPSSLSEPVLVIDAGHGGEDGGASSPNGVRESGLNLEIANCLDDSLHLLGQPVIMTRTGDCALDHGEDTIRARKRSDLKSRVSIVERHAQAILVSVHQNSLPSSPVTRGAQVFWNGQDCADELADSIQVLLNQRIQPDNPKNTRRIPENVYLMNRITKPGILIECGFLSNRGDTAQLQTTAYQEKLALLISAGYLQWCAGEDEP